MAGTDIARRFVDALNAFDGDAVRALVTEDFEFSIGPHTSGREDFLAGVATGPAADPEFHFVVESIDGTDVYGLQEYRWRESGELATSERRVMRLELAAEKIRRAVVLPAP